MTDSSVPPALGVEGVEWLMLEGAESLTVRVTGRWRRRPTRSGQPLLVLEARGQRHRFPAMPEPPSLTGTAPGTWRMTFSVPAALAPGIGARGWLQLGAVVVPLPIEADRREAEQPRAPEQSRAPEQPREPEPREPEQPREPEPREPEPILDAEREAIRQAQQTAHAERMRRVELQEELDRRRREPAEADRLRGELVTARERIRELRRELEHLQRQLDEAAQEAAVARAARERVECELVQRELVERELVEPPAATTDGRAGAICAELEIASRAPPVRGYELDSVADRTDRARSSLDAERTLSAALARRPDQAASRDELIRLQAMLEREQAARAEAQARGETLERELRDYGLRAARAHDAIEELRGEIAALRVTLAAQAASEEAQAAQGEPHAAQAEPEVAQAQREEEPVQAARLDAALSRLREAVAPPAPDAGPPTAPADLPGAGRPWLLPVLRTIVKRDPAGAGRLAVALLPAQPLVQPLPLAYDLVLSDLGCFAVTAAAGVALVQRRDLPRPRAEVQLQVRGQLSGFARLLAAGPVRRRFRRRLARAKGDRRTLKAVRGLVRAPLSVQQLCAAGVAPQPALAFALVAAMVQAEWTLGETFTVAHREPDAGAAGSGLRVRDGAPVIVCDPPIVDAAATITTTIVCPSGSLLAVFGPSAGLDATIEGDGRPLVMLQSWIKRAQSG